MAAGNSNVGVTDKLVALSKLNYKIHVFKMFANTCSVLTTT